MGEGGKKNEEERNLTRARWSRWLQAFEGCISCMTPRSAETYIRIERTYVFPSFWHEPCDAAGRGLISVVSFCC
jgi:hypothetical protein